ncbi:hypothetical protein [Stackebrandtia soli]|uniref:hypothetical protein n=1 Tax=Stackebrandtia soli TaxID=1892856 RepID=UPI0039E962EB
MASHFGAIGMPFTDEESYMDGIRRIADAAEEQVELGDSLILTWKDSSGAALDIVLSQQEDGVSLECVAPRFDGGNTAALAVTGVVDDECAGCVTVGVEVHEGGEMAYPMIVAPARIAAERDKLTATIGTGAATARLGLLAEDVTVFADQEAMSADETLGKFSSESFIPTGMFGDSAPRVLCNGTVVAAERRLNTLFDTPFWVLRVHSYGGDYDLVCSTDDLPDGVRVGQIVSATAWVTADFG